MAEDNKEQVMIEETVSLSVVCVVLENLVTIQEMVGGMVDKGAYLKYFNDIIHFASWMHENEVAWSTDYYGKAM
jgi:hypothetical protein